MWTFSKVGKELKMYKLLSTPINTNTDGALVKV